MTSGKKFPLYYMEAELAELLSLCSTLTHRDGGSALNQATLADMSVYPDMTLMRKMRGREHGCKVAEAFNHHPQSPTTPALP